MNKEILPVLDEITAVLKKHDMVGLVIVGNKSHCDWRMDIEASWSCAKLEETDRGQAIRVRSKRADYPSAEAQHASLEMTVGTFVTISDVLRKLDGNVKEILLMLAKHITFFGRSKTED